MCTLSRKPRRFLAPFRSRIRGSSLPGMRHTKKICAVLLGLTTSVFSLHRRNKNLLTIPPQIHSANGTLRTTITLELATVDFGGKNDTVLRTRLLNGIFPGPTLILQPGDTIEVQFVNKLDLEGLGFVNNEFSAPDESNLHFHGLFISGELPSDDSTYVIAPGDSYTYRTQLPPEHMGGTHWLHPHRHGSSALQTGGGAVGAVIVSDPPGTLPEVVAYARDVLFLVQPMDLPRLQRLAEQSNDVHFSYTSSRVRSNNKLDQGKHNANEGPNSGSDTQGARVAFIAVNGMLEPTLFVDAGEWIRVRIIFATWLKGTLDWEVPGCELVLLAKDGIYIADFPRPITVAPIVPGGRADILMRCPAPNTVYTIRAHGGSRTIGFIETGTRVHPSSDLPSWSPRYPSYLTNLVDTPATPGCICATEFDGVNAVNGRSYRSNTVLHQSRLGDVVERRISVRDHPYHQHVYPFQLVSGRFGDDTNTYNAIGDWHDSISGEGVFRYQPTKYVGKVMVHCHQLKHEDQGMMTTELVVARHEATPVLQRETCRCTKHYRESMVGLMPGIVLLGAVGLLFGLFSLWLYRRYRRRGYFPVTTRKEHRRTP